VNNLVARYPSVHQKPKPTAVRFWERVAYTFSREGCWPWLGTMHPHGYGRFNADGRLHLAYRWAYEFSRGPVPDGMELDHLCRNRACCNPWHLEAVSHRENTLRGDSFAARFARQTHCKRGHELSGDNLMPASGRRACKLCNRERAAEHYRKRGRT
jgi:hypothetical protein